ncbi:MAG TPA: c-type cytochrome [Polyangiaceae bacterium]|nr:c-type cytochrome [Polyangiaceae bacterium]
MHEYDGIEEADNRLPNWWLATFYGAILFSIGYWFYYHEYNVEPLTRAQYDLDAAEQGSADVAEESDLLALANDPSAIAQGQEAYATTCAACHGDSAQGVIGPNLTDNTWLHGGAPTSIYTSVRLGITADQALIPGSAGMPAWGPQLGEDRVRAVVAFLMSVRNTNEPGRDAEGDVYAPDGDSEAPDEDAAPDESAAPDEETDATDPDGAEEPSDDHGATEDGEQAVEDSQEAPTDEAEPTETTDTE